MSLDRQSAPMEEAMISETFVALACAENGNGRVRVRTYVVDELVLIVTEHEPAPSARHGRDAHGRSVVEIRDPGASQRRTTVETVMGRRVAATLSGRQSDPEIVFELFVLESDDGGHHALGSP
jgi:hypothetical protein